MTRTRLRILTVLFCLAAAPCATAELPLDETPAVPGEWGYRPAQDALSNVNPPSFSWRPPKGIVTYEIECFRGNAVSGEPEYRAQGLEFNVHCPPRVFAAPGVYTWRYRAADAKGNATNWSRPRTFSIAPDAARMPLPPREELLARIPKTHPRLFVRPENLDRLRARARMDLKKQYEDLVRECEKILAKPPATEEPPTYPADMELRGEEWMKMWWGNREYTIRALNGAATLAFTRLLGGKEEYGLEAKRILLECAKWDPKGSTGYRYNDEAGMPYAYHFSRAYSFVNDLLTEEEKKVCRNVMKVRGEEMYNHLRPRHFWRPYESHANRAWHKLGEVGIAFLGEIEGADDWVWFAMNVFFNVYPVWSDENGGWHEGASYWASYQGRFTWWADVMREAMGINAYDKPFFSKAGYYAMYLMPPGKVGGGFGDLTPDYKAEQTASLMSVFAAQSGNGHWQWYVEQLGGPVPASGYIGFVRGVLPPVKPVPPADLPASRLFRGTGQAYLNTSLFDARESVQVVFKSSPLGTQSHGYEANNAFLLWAYGERLLVQTGRRDMHGSAHHKNWMWTTRSVNNITVNGKGQIPHSAAATGDVTVFKTTPAMDIVVGEAGKSYAPDVLTRFSRAILFVKPDLLVVYDRLEAPNPSTFEYWLHAKNRFEIENQRRIRTRAGNVVCDVDFLTPEGLTFSQTDQYDPNPRPRIKVREWHLTATSKEKAQRMEFVTLYRPARAAEQGPLGPAPLEAQLERIPGGYALTAAVAGGEFTALLPTEDQATLKAHDLESVGAITARVRRGNQPAKTITVEDR